MSVLKSDFLRILESRGFIYQCSQLQNLDELLSTQKIKAYIGFDATADSLHIGSLVQIMMLKHLQNTGHTPVALLGGGTTLIGDPTGKDTSRIMLTKEQISLNLEGIKKTLSKFIKFENNQALIMNNAEWLLGFNYINFLRDYGTQFTINKMLTFDSVKLRLDREQPLSFLEFNYMMLQAIDFCYLNKNHGVFLQMGGSDQWGNIINGVELTRKLNKQEVFALTSPLITKSDGSKMGKTLGGAVWLDEHKCSSLEYYQFFRNIDDNDVPRFLKLFTELPLAEIKKLEILQGAEINEAKKILAFEALKICHGITNAKKQAEVAGSTFERNEISANLPTFQVTLGDDKIIGNKMHREAVETDFLVDKLVYLNIFETKSEVKRLIQGGGLKINDVTVDNIDYQLNSTLFHNSILKISIGKKKHILLKLKV